MSKEFDRRVAEARERALAEKQRLVDKNEAAKESAERISAAVADAIEQWDNRIVPLINQVVEAANKQLHGSGTRLVAAKNHGQLIDERPVAARDLPFVEIFGTPENSPTIRRDTRAPHLRISVEWTSEIRTAVNKGIVIHHTDFFPANFNQHQLEEAIADFIDMIVG